MIFQNRKALITGAAGRIGQATARKFAQYGVELFLTDIAMEKLELFAEELRKEGAKVHTVRMDVTSLESIESASCEILQKAGAIHILVNNAGAWPASTALDTSDDQWLKVINLNLHSVSRLSRIFGRKMKEAGYGRIINLGSIAGEVGLPGFSAYSTAKAGVIMLTKTMAMELAKCGITVNSISPGMISGSASPNSGTWTGYCGTGMDVANAIVFLASDTSSYITGVDLPVDGGRTLGPLNPVFQG